MAGGTSNMLLPIIVILFTCGACGKDVINLDGTDGIFHNIEVANHCKEVEITDVCAQWRVGDLSSDTADTGVGSGSSSTLTTLQINKNSPIWDTYIRDLDGKKELSYSHEEVLSFYLERVDNLTDNTDLQNRVHKLLCFLIYPAMPSRPDGTMWCDDTDPGQHHGMFYQF